MKRIITISREFGSGGRELGKRLADALGFRYLDREILQAISKETNLDEDYIENTLERDFTNQIYPISFSRTFYYNPAPVDQTAKLLAKQHDVIKELSKDGDCVIVGRGADTLLEEEHPLRIFVYASMESKINRCIERAPKDEDLSRKDYEKKIKQVDKARGHNYLLYSDKEWGDRENYDLLVNTTEVEVEDLIPSLKVFALDWFKGKK